METTSLQDVRSELIRLARQTGMKINEDCFAALRSSFGCVAEGCWTCPSDNERFYLTDPKSWNGRIDVIHERCARNGSATETKQVSTADLVSLLMKKWPRLLVPCPPDKSAVVVPSANGADPKQKKQPTSRKRAKKKPRPQSRDSKTRRRTPVLTGRR